MTVDDRDRDTEAAMAALLTTAPPSLAPDVLVEVGLADRYARIESPIGPLTVVWNGIGVAAVEAVGPLGDAEFEAAHLARRAAGSSEPRLSRRDSPPPSPAGWAATGASGSTSTCAATPRSSAMSGTRRSRSRAARSGRTAGSPPRSAARRRSVQSAPRSATTPCR